MELQHISISPQGGSSFDVLFNPTQYGLDKGNQLAEIGVPGLEAPIIQYVRGNARVLTMELFFDTYEERTDVSQYTDKIYKLLKINPSTHAPPICDLGWGKFRFHCVLESASGKFTLFLADGTPVRATVNVTFKEYIDVQVLVREQPTQSADHRKSRLVKHGDRIDSIASEELEDSAMWRMIADANGLKDPRCLQVGQRLSIPAIA
jgi:hypothetical protein